MKGEVIMQLQNQNEYNLTNLAFGEELQLNGVELNSSEKDYLEKNIEAIQNVYSKHIPIKLLISKNRYDDSLLGDLFFIEENGLEFHQVGGNIYQLMKRLKSDLDYRFKNEQSYRGKKMKTQMFSSLS